LGIGEVDSFWWEKISFFNDLAGVLGEARRSGDRMMALSGETAAKSRRRF
jgi:hypothetical protein